MDSESKLEKLDFSGSYNFGDREAIMLANLLSGHMTTVKPLNLENVSSISDPGWRSFATVLLPSSTSNLKELKLGGNDEAYLSNIRRCFSLHYHGTGDQHQLGNFRSWLRRVFSK